MKRNFLKVAATAVAALLAGATVAQAASVEWGGSLRPRFEVNERHDMNDNTSADFFISQQTRLHAKADILPDTSAFIQLQSVQTWGNNLNSGNQTDGSGSGSGNSSFTVDDRDSTVGVHQAYFTLKNFATLPVDLQVGRQEIILDGHRLFGNTVWTQGQQTHDAALATHKQGNITAVAAYVRGNDGGLGTVGTTTVQADPEDVDVYVGYVNVQGILGGGLSLLYAAVDDECGNAGGAACTAGPSDNDIHTIGARQAGQLFGLDYRGEFYYQFGGAEASATNVAGGYTTLGAGSGIDRKAYMFGARVGKKFNNVMWKPSLTLWYDYLSGTSDEDARDGDFKTFHTLFDTGHKFYGLMDMFLPFDGANTNHLGLVDYAVKSSIQPAKGWKLKAAWHYFTTAEGGDSNPLVSGGAAAQGTRFDGNKLGHEIDLTLVHKYNANTTITAGWSHFAAESLFHRTAGGAGTGGTTGNDNADWAYLQFHVKF